MAQHLQEPERRTARWVGMTLSAALLGALTTTGAQAASFCVPGPGDRPETGLQGAIPLAERTAPGGFQGFWCGTRKVAQHTLFDRGSFGDVQFIGRCAYASMRDPSDLNAPTTGTAVLDVTVPSAPTFVQMLLGELFPKNLAIARPEPVAVALARSTGIYLTVFGWLIAIFDRSSNLLLRLLRIEPVIRACTTSGSRPAAVRRNRRGARSCSSTASPAAPDSAASVSTSTSSFQVALVSRCQQSTASLRAVATAAIW